MTELTCYTQEKRRESKRSSLEYRALHDDDASLNYYIELERTQYRHDFWEQGEEDEWWSDT